MYVSYGSGLVCGELNKSDLKKKKMVFFNPLLIMNQYSRYYKCSPHELRQNNGLENLEIYKWCTNPKKGQTHTT